MLIGIMQNLPEIIMGTVYTCVIFWLGRKSVGFNAIEFVKNRFRRS
jgi:hypothetical protein